MTIRVYTRDGDIGTARTWSDADALARAADGDVFADETRDDGCVVKWSWYVAEGDSTPEWWLIT